MSSKTNTDKIEELGKELAALTAGVSALERTVEDVKGSTKEHGEVFSRLADLEQLVSDIREDRTESSRRRWSLIPVLFGAVLGGIIPLLVQAILRYIPR